MGAWNPAIITPIWLRQQFPELFPGDAFEAEFIAGAAVSVRFTINDVQIDPSNGRLVLASPKEDQRTFESLPRLAMSICDRLPHTPIAAVGLNFVFQTSGETALAVDRFLDQRAQDQFYANLSLSARLGRQITHTFALPESTLNLTYEYKPEGTTLRFNFHKEVTSIQQLGEALGRFANQLAEARRLSDAIDPRNNP